MTRELHLRRVARMLADLDIVPAALLPRGPGMSLVDGNSMRAVTPPLGNQTLAEGLVSAIKLSALQLGEAPASKAPASKAPAPEATAAGDDLLAAAEALAEAVHFDEAGTWVGLIQQGGNGGLLSRETLRRADRLETAVAAARARGGRVASEAGR